MTWIFHIIYCVHMYPYVYMLWFMCYLYMLVCHRDLVKQPQTFITYLLLCVCSSMTFLSHASLVNKLKIEKHRQTD